MKHKNGNKTQFFIIIFLFLICVNFALANNISKFVFTTNSQTIKPNEVSETLTVQTRDSDGNSVKIPQTSCLKLETNSTTGEFSASSTKWISVNELTMNKGWANRNFYYKDSTNGNYTLTVKVALTFCSEWTKEEWIIKQDIVVTDISTSTFTIPTPPISNINWPVESQIFANAGDNKIAIVGADVKFSGKALGIKKEPLENARYLWNFGDGKIGEGQNVLHFYQYPGEYIVVLNVASGQYSATDNLLIKIIPNQLKISEANQKFIKLQNESNIILDISNWFLKSGNKIFKFPESTLINADSILPIPSSISGITTSDNSVVVELLYPNGSVAYFYSNFTPKTQIQNENKKSTTIIDSIVNIISGSDNIAISTSTLISTSTPVLTNQAANIIAATQNNSLDFKKWLMIILGISIFAGIGLLFIRNQNFFK